MSNSESLCPVCEKPTPRDLLACQVCHAEIHSLWGKKLSDAEKSEIRHLLTHIHFAHYTIIGLFILSWILIRVFLWR
ncbi:MAG: hypothetical protein AABZ60_12050 [Planctomycetota bacterium]